MIGYFVFRIEPIIFNIKMNGLRKNQCFSPPVSGGRMRTLAGTTGYYVVPVWYPSFSDVKLAMLHVSNVKVKTPYRFLAVFSF